MRDHEWHEGRPRVIALPNGPAAAGIAFDFPGSTAYKVLSVTFSLTTSGGGAARQVLASLLDSTGAPVFSTAAPGTQASGLTVAYTFSGDSPVFGTSALGHMGAPFLEEAIPQNITLSVTVAAPNAADRITLARCLVLARPRAVGYPAAADAA